MSSDETFESFVTCVVAGNNLLDGHPLHLSHAQLRVMVEGNLATYLADHIDDLSQEEQDRLADIMDYNDWESEIKCIDRKFHANYQRFLNLHSLHQTRSTSTSSHNSSSSQKHVTKPVDIPAPKCQRFTNSSASQSYPATGSNTINSDLPPLNKHLLPIVYLALP